MKGTLVSGLATVAGLFAGAVSAIEEVSGVDDVSANVTLPQPPSWLLEDGNDGAPEPVINAASPRQYYLVWFIPPRGSVITNFVSTMHVPKMSPNVRDGTRYVWPGLENATGNFVFQDVIGDHQPLGDWRMATWEVGHGHHKEHKLHQVAHGDRVKSTFHLKDRQAGTWSEHFKISGHYNTKGGIPNFNFGDVGDLKRALFAIELYNPAKWDFGSVTWTDISITATTQETGWCTSPNFVTQPHIGGFKHSITKPRARKHNGKVTCTVDKIVFIAP